MKLPGLVLCLGIGQCSTPPGSVDKPQPAEPTYIKPNDNNLVYTGVVNTKLSETEGKLYRFTDSYMATFGLWNGDKGKNQAGVTIKFKTSSPNFKLNFIPDDNDTPSHDPGLVGIFRDGELIETQWSDNQLVVNTSNVIESTWEITMPGYKPQIFTGLELDNGYDLKSLTDTRPIMLSIGDSITHGVGQTGMGTHLTYGYKTAKELDYRFVNMAIRGSRINSEVSSNIIGITPAIITILWGFNDVNAGAEDLSIANGRLTTLITDLKTSFPSARIIVILQTYTTVEIGLNPANTITRLRSDQTAIAIAQGVEYVNALDWTGPESLEDSAHLNDLGAQQVADGLHTYITTP